MSSFLTKLFGAKEPPLDLEKIETLIMTKQEINDFHIVAREKRIAELESEAYQARRLRELVDEQATCIAELEAELAEKTEWNIELDALNVKLYAQIEAVEEQINLMPQSGSGYDYWVRQLRAALQQGESDE